MVDEKILNEISENIKSISEKIDGVIVEENSVEENGISTGKTFIEQSKEAFNSEKEKLQINMNVMPKSYAEDKERIENTTSPTSENISIENKQNALMRGFEKRLENRYNQFEAKIADGIGKVIGTVVGVKNTIVEVTKLAVHPVDTIKELWTGKDGVTNTISSALGFGDNREDLMKVGVYKSNLNITKVLTSSTAGVAVVWLAKQLGITDGRFGLGGKIKGLASDLLQKIGVNAAASSIGNMGGQLIGTVIKPFIMSALPWLIGAVVALFVAKWWMSLRNRVNDDMQKYSTGVTTKELNANATKADERQHNRLNMRYGASAKTEEEANQFIENRAQFNGLNWGVPAGAVVAGGATYLAGNLAAGGLISGVGATGAVAALASNPVGWGIAAALGAGAITYGLYKLFTDKEKVKKGGDQLEKEKLDKKYSTQPMSNNVVAERDKLWKQVLSQESGISDNSKYIKDIYNKTVEFEPQKTPEVEVPTTEEYGRQAKQLFEGVTPSESVTYKSNPNDKLTFNPKGYREYLIKRGIAKNRLDEEVENGRMMAQAFSDKGINPVFGLAQVINETGLNSNLYRNKNNTGGVKIFNTNTAIDRKILGRDDRNHAYYGNKYDGALDQAKVLARNGIGNARSSNEYVYMAKQSGYFTGDYDRYRRNHESITNALIKSGAFVDASNNPIKTEVAKLNNTNAPTVVQEKQPKIDLAEAKKRADEQTRAAQLSSVKKVAERTTQQRAEENRKVDLANADEKSKNKEIENRNKFVTDLTTKHSDFAEVINMVFNYQFGINTFGEAPVRGV